MAQRNPTLRAFIRIKANGEVIPGSVVLRKKQPSDGRWYEIPANVCCTSTSTTTQSVLGAARSGARREESPEEESGNAKSSGAKTSTSTTRTTKGK